MSQGQHLPSLYVRLPRHMSDAARDLARRQNRPLWRVLAWSLHQGIVHPDALPECMDDVPCPKTFRIPVGPTLDARLREVRPEPMNPSEFLRRTLRAGFDLIQFCPCWLCAGYATPSREPWSKQFEAITRLTPEEMQPVEQFALAQGRDRVSAFSVIVEVGLTQPELMKAPAQESVRESQRVYLTRDLPMLRTTRTEIVRRAYYTGLAVLGRSRCCRRQLMYGGEIVGIDPAMVWEVKR